MTNVPGSGSPDAESAALPPEDGSPLLFAIASRDELWINGNVVESRLMHGQARQLGNRIEADDGRDATLMNACDRLLDVARARVEPLRSTRLRIRVRATRENGVDSTSATIILAIGGVSVVTTPDCVLRDHELLLQLAALEPAVSPGHLPLVWQNGSAAVLLHEAIGHAKEQGAAPVAWPSWLSVDVPIASRREMFRDVPLPRMTHLTARQHEAPFAIPRERIEVHLIGGGAYDPVTDIVTINVAVSSAGAFTIRRTRREIAASLAGALGDPVRYPGVICAREGQELHIASHAPVMITDALL